MKIKENIHKAINKMDTDELILIHEQITLLESMKRISKKKTKSISLEKITEMTSSSKSSWSDALREERAKQR